MKVLISAIIRKESRYLDEWISWNLYCGADKIVIYDNNKNLPEETRKSKSIVDKYVKKGYNLEYNDWNHLDGIAEFFGKKIEYQGRHNYFLRAKQEMAYDHAISKNKDYDINLSIDIDEFVTPLDNLPLRGCLKRLGKYMKDNNIQAAKLPSYFYGSGVYTSKDKSKEMYSKDNSKGNLKNKIYSKDMIEKISEDKNQEVQIIKNNPEKYFVTDTYFLRAQKPLNFKTADNTSYTEKGSHTVHLRRYKPNLKQYVFIVLVISYFLYMSYNFNNILMKSLCVILGLTSFTLFNVLRHRAVLSNQNILRLNHYFLKSEDEFIKKRDKKVSCYDKTFQKDELLNLFNEKNKDMNQVKDESVKPYFKEYYENMVSVI